MSPVGESDAAVAVAAAQAGARVVRRWYGVPVARHAKAGLDFATDADLEAERAIVAVLRRARPGDRVSGEEGGDLGPASARRTWLVDPLGGTRNFAAQLPLVSVNVALSVDGRWSAAAAADPVAGEVFWTDGDGAFRGHADGDAPLEPSSLTRIVNLNVDGWHGDPGGAMTQRLLLDPGFAESFAPRVSSTTQALAWVAAGRHAAYVTHGDVLDSVHFAAGIALCRAAGCVVTGLAGQPLHEGVGGLVAAADEGTHAQLIRLLTR